MSVAALDLSFREWSRLHCSDFLGQQFGLTCMFSPMLLLGVTLRLKLLIFVLRSLPVSLVAQDPFKITIS